MRTTSRRASAVVLGAAAAVALVAGCGAVKTTSSASTSSATAATGTAGAATSGSGGGSGGSSQVTTAAAYTAKYTAQPTAINQTVPLTGKVPQGRTYVVITCELPQCHFLSDGAVAAAKAIGWKPQVLSYMTTDGSTLTAAMKQALQYNPIAVSPVGYSQTVWTSLLPQYRAAHAIIAPIAVGDATVNDVVPGAASPGSDYTKSGQILGNWFISDSNGTGHALVMDVPTFQVLKDLGDGFKSAVSSGCSACKVTPLNVTPAQLAANGIIPAIISGLQRDPSIKYLIATDGAFIPGMPAALKAAGLNGIKIAGGSADIDNTQDLKNGTEAAWTTDPASQIGWIAVDIAARKTLGMSVPADDGGMVQQLLTPANVGTPSNFLIYPTDYAAQYKKLWGVS